MKRYLTSLALAGLLTGSVLGVAHAQQATPIQQSSTELRASTFVQQAAGGSTACSTVNTTQANDTITITPPAGQSVYLQSLYITQISDTTGTTGLNVFTSTNLTGNPVWSIGSVVPTANMPTPVDAKVIETWPAGLKSTAAGTAVTIVGPAQNAHLAWCMHASGYFAP